MEKYERRPKQFLNGYSFSDNNRGYSTESTKKVSHHYVMTNYTQYGSEGPLPREATNTACKAEFNPYALGRSYPYADGRVSYGPSIKHRGSHKAFGMRSRHVDHRRTRVDETKSPTPSASTWSSFYDSNTKYDDILGHFADCTSLPSVGFVRTSKFSVVKVVWVLLYLAAMGGALFQLYPLLMKLLEHPIKTKVSLGHGDIEFPSVTICNVNPIRQLRVEDDLNVNNYYWGTVLKAWLKENEVVDGPDESSGSGGDMSNLMQDGDMGYPTDEGSTDGFSPNEMSGGNGNTNRRKKRSLRSNLLNIRRQIKNIKHNNAFSYPLAERKKREAMPNGSADQFDGSADQLDGSADQFDYDDYIDYDYYYWDDLEEYEPVYGNVSEQEKILATILMYFGRVQREKRMKMGHQAKDTILRCSFNGIKCSYENFTTVTDPQYGNCFRFNTPETRTVPLRAMKEGMRKGLNLVLHTNKWDYLTYVTESVGFRLSIDRFNTGSYPSETGISISPGLQTSVGMRMLNISRLGAPYWGCVEEDSYLQQYRMLYTYNACTTMCPERFIAANCSCFRPEFSDYYVKEQVQNLTACYVNKTQHACARKVEARLRTANMQEACGCSAACRELAFSRTYSVMQWPDVGMWTYIVDLICKNMNDSSGGFDGESECDYVRHITPEDEVERRSYLNEYLANVIVYYESLNFQEIEEDEDYSIDDFGSDIGGYLGLWTGFCIFTSVELAFLLFNTLLFCCWRKKWK